MEDILKQVRTALQEAADPAYCEFNRSLIPGDAAPMLGVRMPALRAIAKRLVKAQGYEYIREITEYEKSAQPYHEELLMHGILIGYLPCGREERKRLLDEFIPRMDNWSVCDSSCITYKFVKEDEEYWFSYLLTYARKDREYEIRFAVVMFLLYYISEPYIERILETLSQIKHEAYYVKMAVAWAISMCYVKFPERTWFLLESDALDDFTHQKSIQKIRESLQVSKEEKKRVNALRRSR